MADTVRFDRIMALSPRRFHISANPPYGVGIVICSHINEDREAEDQLFANHEGIADCKPGIWRSSYCRVKAPEGQWSYAYDPTECILHWVADGTIDLGQPVKEWEESDKAAREIDATMDLENTLLQGVEWESRGTFFDDGGVCAVLSSDYVTREAAKKIVIENGQDKDSDDENDEEEEEDEDNDEEEEEEEEEDDDDFDFGYYLERVTLNNMDMSGRKDNAFFTLGGMNCTCSFPLCPI
jgi:hypothetical protein